MKIKFVDLFAQNQEVQERVEHDLSDLHRKAAYVGGEYVKSFEEEFAAFLGVKRATGVGSGTDALRLTLLALGVGFGDEVITTPMTFIATTAAILQTGATPVFVDIDPETGNIDPQAVQRYLTAENFRAPNGPKAILPVHLYGAPAAVEALGTLAREHRLHLVEDACQAHGARVLSGQHWRSAGSFGAGACFSFTPGRTWEPGAKPARWSPTTMTSPIRSSRCATMAGFRTTHTIVSDTTHASMRCKRSSCARNSLGCPTGTHGAGRSRANIANCYVTAASVLSSSRKARSPAITSLWSAAKRATLSDRSC